jgi:6-carboxyhexanoate--CoA ligase
MWSVRMRASRGEEHISGAEGLFTDGEVERAMRDYLKRVEVHPRGKADGIVLSVEKLRTKPREISLLPVVTIECSSPIKARRLATRLLKDAGVSEEAIDEAFAVVRGARAMRGAALVAATDGIRLEPDPKRGVRTSRLGIEKRARSALARGLARHGINTITVKEAIALASKVLSLKNIVAELCVSDDPDYTTGYVATRRLGYVRIPEIKKKGSPRGGRVYFVKNRAKLSRAIEYLESEPAIITSVSGISGVTTIDELLDGANR